MDPHKNRPRKLTLLGPPFRARLGPWTLSRQCVPQISHIFRSEVTLITASLVRRRGVPKHLPCGRCSWSIARRRSTVISVYRLGKTAKFRISRPKAALAPNATAQHAQDLGQGRTAVTPHRVRCFLPKQKRSAILRLVFCSLNDVNRTIFRKDRPKRPATQKIAVSA